MALFVPNFVLVAAIGVGALAVLEVVLPATLVLVAVGVGQGALALLEAVLEFTLVRFAVTEGIGALAVPQAVLEMTSVVVAIGPVLGALAVSAISFDALGFRALPFFDPLFVPAGLQRRARSAPHRHRAICMELQLIFYL